MTYQETVDYIYDATPQFQLIGAAAYHPGLETARVLDDALGHPHSAYPCVHVAGTNGKGSVTHSLASIMMAAGYKVGLYTSPHLFDFRERVRVDGKPVSESAVIEFVERYRSLRLGVKPSFFELTTLMAFDYFKREKVDVAIIEVGLGGRLDTTNIISPCLCAITNISRDHMAQLGHSLELIAKEKAGIIKPGVEVVVGNADDPAVKAVFDATAEAARAKIVYAAENKLYQSYELTDCGIIYRSTPFGDLTAELSGACQPENTATILNLVEILQAKGFAITDSAVARGLATVVEATGLMGRWMKVASSPLTICDTGHNEGGWRHLSRSLGDFPGRRHIVLGFVNDKDVGHILQMMPADSSFYFAQAYVPRAMPSGRLAEIAALKGLGGQSFPTVAEAYRAALAAASPADMIFVGGSTFVVADFLRSIHAPS